MQDRKEQENTNKQPHDGQMNCCSLYSANILELRVGRGGRQQNVEHFMLRRLKINYLIFVFVSLYPLFQNNLQETVNITHEVKPHSTIHTIRYRAI